MDFKLLRHCEWICNQVKTHTYAHIHTCSELNCVKAWVSILGLLLFDNFINDLPSNVGCDIVLYVDTTHVTASVELLEVNEKISLCFEQSNE